MSKEIKIFDVVSAWVEELSLAPMGHNGKKYLLVKGQTMDSKALKKLLSESDEELTEILEKAGLGDEALEAGTLIGRLLKAYGDELPNGFLTILAQATGLDAPEGGEGTGAGMKKASGKTGGGEGEGATKTPDGGISIEEALAKAPPELQPILKQMLKATADADARAQAAEKEALALKKAAQESYFDELMTDLAGLPGDHTQLRKALMTINSSFPVEVGVITSSLKKAAMLQGKGGLGQAGRDGPGDSMNKAGSAEGEIERRAAQLMKKAPEMSKEEAVAMVLEKAPELYDQYLAQMGGT